MGGQSSKVLDHVKMTNKDNEVTNAKLLKLIKKEGSDVNYSGKVHFIMLHK